VENTDHILDAPEVEAIRLEYAGFWIRTAAYIIDSIVVGLVAFAIGFVLGDLQAEAIGTVINLLIGVCYFALMESSTYQATVGKMAVGIKVGDHDGDAISVSNAIGRYFAKILSAIVLCIGFMMVGWDEKKQGMHDKLANTYVFYRR